MWKFNKKKQSTERPGLVVTSKPSSVVAEQFRTIRTNIQFSMIDSNIKNMVVTSAGPGSGKSIISANLAATFASQEKKVLLVDADLRKPTVHQTFQIHNLNGLTTLLTNNDVGFDDVIHKTYTDGLDILTSGTIPPNPAELLASKKMEELIIKMKDMYDLVIFDMPPVMAVTDAQIMSSKVDGTLFVIPKGQATKDEVIKSKELLDNVNANVLGAIFNRVENKNDNYYYYGSE